LAILTNLMNPCPPSTLTNYMQLLILNLNTQLPNSLSGILIINLLKASRAPVKIAKTNSKSPALNKFNSGSKSTTNRVTGLPPGGTTTPRQLTRAALGNNLRATPNNSKTIHSPSSIGHKTPTLPTGPVRAPRRRVAATPQRRPPSDITSCLP
jgi:hypothetical protein